MPPNVGLKEAAATARGPAPTIQMGRQKGGPQTSRAHNEQRKEAPPSKLPRLKVKEAAEPAKTDPKPILKGVPKPRAGDPALKLAAPNSYGNMHRTPEAPHVHAPAYAAPSWANTALDAAPPQRSVGPQRSIVIPPDADMDVIASPMGNRFLPSDNLPMGVSMNLRTGLAHSSSGGPVPPGYLQVSVPPAAANLSFAASPEQAPGALYNNAPNFSGLHAYPNSVLQPRPEHSIPVHLSREDRNNPAFRALQEENIRLRVELTKLRNEVASTQQRERLANEMQVQRLEQNMAWERQMFAQQTEELKSRLEQSERKQLRATAGLKMLNGQIQERHDEVKRIKDWISQVVRKAEEARFGEERFQKVMDVFQSATQLHRQLDGTLHRLSNIELHTNVDGMPFGELQGEIALQSYIDGMDGSPGAGLGFHHHSPSNEDRDYAPVPPSSHHRGGPPAAGGRGPPPQRAAPPQQRPKRTTNFVEAPTNQEPTPRDIIAAKREKANAFPRFKA